MQFLVQFLIAGVEHIIHAWVILLAIDGNVWAIVGLIAYNIFWISLSDSLKKVAVNIITPICLTVIYIYFGFWIAVLAFLIFALIGEGLRKN